MVLQNENMKFINKNLTINITKCSIKLLSYTNHYFNEYGTIYCDVSAPILNEIIHNFPDNLLYYLIINYKF